jgi:hypothetical protein
MVHRMFLPKGGTAVLQLSHKATGLNPASMILAKRFTAPAPHGSNTRLRRNSTVPTPGFPHGSSTSPTRTWLHGCYAKKKVHTTPGAPLQYCLAGGRSCTASKHPNSVLTVAHLIFPNKSPSPILFIMFVLCVSLEELIPPRCQLGPPMFI